MKTEDTARPGLFDNPLIQRHRYSQLRPRQFWVLQIVYLCLVGLILLINRAVYLEMPNPDFTDYCRILYVQFLIMEVLILWFWTAHNSGSAIKDEVINRTYDFFKILPLPAHQKTIGILIGSNLVALLLAAMNAVFLLVFARLGELSLRFQVHIFFMLIAVAAFFSTSVLLSSIRPHLRGKQDAGAVVSIVFAAFVIMPMLFQALAAVSEFDIDTVRVPFYHLRVPVLLLLGSFALYFAAWCFVGALRKFTREREPMFTAAGALLFLVGWEVLSFGCLFAKTHTNSEGGLGAFWALGLLPLIFIPFGSLQTADRYLERCRSLPSMGRFLAQSNLVAHARLFAVWATFSLAAVAWNEARSFAGCAASVVVMFSFFLVLTSLLELHVLFSPANPKMRLLLGFLAILYVVLPLIFAGVLSMPDLIRFSPAGYFTLAFDGYCGRGDAEVFLVNLCLVAIPALLIGRRYQSIMKQREAMRV